VQTAVTLEAVSQGLGKAREDIDDSSATSVEQVREDSTPTLTTYLRFTQLLYASDLLYVATIYMSKLTLALFFYRLSSSRGLIACSLALAAACCVFCAISMMVFGVQQPYLSPWVNVMENDRVCQVLMRHFKLPLTGPQLRRWIAVEAMSNLIELCLLIFPIFLVTGLQMKTSMKAKVITGVGLRFPYVRPHANVPSQHIMKC